MQRQSSVLTSTDDIRGQPSAPFTTCLVDANEITESLSSIINCVEVLLSNLQMPNQFANWHAIIFGN